MNWKSVDACSLLPEDPTIGIRRLSFSFSRFQLLRRLDFKTPLYASGGRQKTGRSTDSVFRRSAQLWPAPLYFAPRLSARRTFAIPMLHLVRPPYPLSSRSQSGVSSNPV